MAALDFIVCDESEVFVTNNNGNMARILAGRRRYFGHKRTIRPNSKRLYSLFSNRTSMTWEAFSSKVLTSQSGFMGEPNEVRPSRGKFHENPSTCICQNTKAKEWNTDEKVGILMHKDASDEVSELHDAKDGEYELPGDNWYRVNMTGPDYDLFIRSKEPVLEEILSD